MKKKFLKLLLFVLIFLFSVKFVFAGTFDQVVDSNGIFQESYGSKAIADGVLSSKSLPEIIGDIIKVILGLSGTIALVFIVWSGVEWATSAGDKSKIQNSKNRMISAAIGIFIIAVSYAITDFVIRQLTAIAG